MTPTRIVERGLKIIADNYTLVLRLGAAELMKGNPEKAEQIFREAIAKHPDIALGYVALGKALLKSGREADAARVLQEAAARMPADFLLEYFSGMALAQAGQDGEAERAFGRAVELNPGEAQARFERQAAIKLDKPPRQRVSWNARSNRSATAACFRSAERTPSWAVTKCSVAARAAGARQ